MNLSQIELRVNGTCAAYAPMFGCRCPRCAAGADQAGTSVSLIGDLPDGHLFHLLVDAGRGVAVNLLDSPRLAERPALDWVALSHWHPDHTTDLPILLTGWRRSQMQAGAAAAPVRVWCRAGSGDWLQRDYPYLFPRALQAEIDPDRGPTGRLLAPLPLDCPDLTVTPFTVSHSSADTLTADESQHAFCCASFLVETAKTKTVLLWDIDGRNDWINHPADAEQEALVVRLQAADHLFIDCNGRGADAPRRSKTHATLDDAARYAAVLRPRHTWLTHLSGHEDEPGAGFGWTDDEWTWAATSLWQQRGLSGAAAAAVPGLRLTLG